MRNSSKTFGKQTIPLFVLLAISFSALPAQAKYGGGKGEPNDPYLIYDANQMNTIGIDPNDWDKHFKLMADIDLSDFTGAEFNIIGIDYYNPFTGVFDGNGHAILNFSFTSTDTNRVGLFGYVDMAEIKDLGLTDPNVDAGTGDYVGSLVGSLVGYMGYGIISNCYVEGGSVSGGRYVGGLVGDNSGTITNCYSTGSVSGTTDVGGLVGLNTYWCFDLWCEFGTISNCYSTGSVSGDDSVGGLVGNNSVTITNCYSAGSVEGTTNVGGLVARNNGEVSASFWDIETSSQTTSAAGTPKTTAEMQTASTFIGWGCGSVWTIDEGNDYPRLWWENKPGEIITTPSYGGGSGDANDPYLIYTADHLNIIASIPCHLERHFKLMADIDLSGYTGTDFNIIGNFTGVFDGNGRTISNFTYTSTGTSHIGLFGYVSGLIKDLGLIDPNVDAGTGNDVGSLVGRLYNGTISNCYVQGGSVTGHWYVGGLVGENDGTIFNCYSKGRISGAAYIGGVVGKNDRGNVSYCYFEGIVSGAGSYSGGIAGINWSWATISNCYSSGSVYGPAHLGGLAGGNFRGSTSAGIITNCYSTSTVEGNRAVGGLLGLNKSVVLNSYSTGSVSGTTDVGGLVGYDDLGVYNSSFWDSDVNPDVNGIGNTNDPDVIGESTENMQTESTFTDAGWDFTTPVWEICDRTNYPKLAWQIPIGDFVCPDGVNFFDYSFFAGHWAEDNCATSNDCDGRDFDLLGSVDINDLRIFADNWLAGL